nr:DEAD-box ATP-dependent RNA helicase 50 [Ipomoea trifida]GMD39434.1 DEAD-box ATP-dependent RNA helicase 50 [Ipomoea batatas]
MMLAEAAAVAAAVAPPPYAVNSFKFRRAMVLQPIPLAGSGNVVNLTSCRRKRREVQGSYTRRPMDTPGAYELIDNGTGEKVIVWGGVENDDDDSAIPSKELLSAWKSKSRTGGDVKASNKTLAGSFSRLKFHKMKALVKKSYTKEQEDDFRDHDEQNARVSATPEVDDFGEQERFDLLDDSSRSVQALDSEVLLQKLRRRMVKDSSDTANENDVRQLHIQNKESDAKSITQTLSASKDSVNHMGGWGKVDDFYRQKRMLNDSNNFFSKKSFQDLGCSDYLIESLRKQMFGFPSHIQAMAFERVIEGKSCIISDQSGSGKTLAYLLPLIQRLREEELQGLGKPLSQNPRVIVLTPTAELASQVLNVCRSFSKSGVPFRSVVATGGFRQRTQLENLRQELDVLIATPGRFMFLVKEGHLHLTNLNCAVLDEVDILFKDEDFETALQCLVTSSPVTAQFLFVTATLPVDIYNKLVENFPDCELITGPGMHRTSTGLEEVLVDCSGEEGSEKTPDTAFLNKKNALLQLAEESPVPKTIVFCNKIESCRKVENALKRFDRKGIYVRVLPFHAALDREMRLASMKEFHSPQPKNVSMFLVCTDRASRGIDFTGVDHVVLFDFPRDPSEYVRRVGRTARGAGGKGKAFIFVVGKQVSLAQRIIERNKKGHPLHDVPYT